MALEVVSLIFKILLLAVDCWREWWMKGIPFMQTKRSILGILAVGFSAFLSAQTGSLFETRAASTPSLFSDRTSFQIGDLITIVVEHSTQTQVTAQTQTSKSNSLQDALNHVFYNMPNGTGQFYRYRDQAPSSQWSGDRSHKGDGSINNKETFTTSIQARVTDALPNSTLRILGKRNFTTSEETINLTVTGIVRREDLTITNSVTSSKIADLQIKQESTGTLSRDQKKGFLTKIYETINPF
jgi:flagellar L-ring protein FlgH